MRPRFELQLPVERSTWLEALREVLEEQRGVCSGQVFRKHAVIEMRGRERSFWSPYLNLEVEDEPGGSAIHGRFSPHPHVWTLFMAIYVLLVIVGLGGAVYGFVQMTLGRVPYAFLLIPGAIVLFGLVYGATLIGQGLGAEQMYLMRSLVDRASEDAIEERISIDGTHR